MSEDKPKHRLITRSDFDGLASAVLFKSLDMIDEIMFVHPKDMQDGKIGVTENDITTNLPYVPGCFLAFDHHHSEVLRTPLAERKNHIIDPSAPSAARIVYNYYGGRDVFPNVPTDLMDAVDKADAADFTIEEVLHPTNWTLLSFIMDSRTGLGRFRHFRISNYQLMMDLIDYCQNRTIEEILALNDVKERVDLYTSHNEMFQDQIKRCSTVHGPLVVLDLREEELLYTGNRFMVYALFPDCSISIHILWGLRQQNTVFATGKSIFRKDLDLNVGELMLAHGGGGHVGAGTCQAENDQADRVLAELIEEVGGMIPEES